MALLGHLSTYLLSQPGMRNPKLDLPLIVYQTQNGFESLELKVDVHRRPYVSEITKWRRRRFRALVLVSDVNGKDELP